METRYLVGELQNYVMVKFVGNATMKTSKTLENFFINLLKGEEKNIILDFEECNYIDSTVLGLIAKTALEVKKIWHKKMFEMNASNMVRSSLNSTSVYDLLIPLKENNEEFSFLELKNKTFHSDEERAKHLLETHKTLINLSKDNEKAFKDIVKLLEEDINNPH